MASRKQAGSVVEVGSSHVAEIGTGSQRSGFGGVSAQRFRESRLKLFSVSERKGKKEKRKKSNLKDKQTNTILIDTRKSQQVPRYWHLQAALLSRSLWLCLLPLQCSPALGSPNPPLLNCPVLSQPQFKCASSRKASPVERSFL